MKNQFGSWKRGDVEDEKSRGIGSNRRRIAVNVGLSGFASAGKKKSNS